MKREELKFGRGVRLPYELDCNVGRRYREQELPPQ